MGTRVVAVLLLVALVGGSQAGVQDDHEPLADCQIGTLSCSPDCREVRICLGGGVYGEVEDCWATTHVSLCDPATMTCNAELTVCPFPDPYKFICVDPKGGLFPNPYDCHKYFECQLPAAIAVLYNCFPATNGYDPLTGMCILPSSHRVCKEGPVPTCVVSMQSGALKENPNMYYVCVSIEGVLQPVLARCDMDTQIFHDGQCVEVEESTTVETTTAAVTTTSPEVTTTSPEVTTTSPDVTTTTPPATTTKYYCTTPGTTVPDPLNCRAYYLCTLDMEQIHFMCKEGYHYDKEINRCVKGTC